MLHIFNKGKTYLVDVLGRYTNIWDLRCLFKTVWTIIRKFQPNSQCIKDNNGEIITEPDKITERWREYWQDLYKLVNRTTKPKKDWKGGFTNTTKDRSRKDY